MTNEPRYPKEVLGLNDDDPDDQEVVTGLVADFIAPFAARLARADAIEQALKEMAQVAQDYQEALGHLGVLTAAEAPTSERWAATARTVRAGEALGLLVRAALEAS